MTVLAAVFILPLVSGCAGTDRKTAFSESPIALVSVVANSDVNWKDEPPLDPGFISRSQRRAMDENPDQTVITNSADFIDAVEQTIRATLENSPYIVFAPSADVTGASAYINARESAIQVKDKMAKPAGYRYVDFRDNNFIKGFAAETGIKKMLFITLDITKRMNSGISKFGSARADVSMSVMLKDENGKNLFYKIYESSSRDQTKVSNSIYSNSELQQMIIDAIQDVCYTFTDDLLQ
ncbi:MAG: hypothetical protein FWF22_01990 [Treponema sp.]|nr:hypothetical protein [Treponema sp.]